MRQFCKYFFFSIIAAAQIAAGEGSSASLSEARAAVEANLRTPDGKKYDEQFGSEFVQEHIAVIRNCKQSVGDEKRSFWMLLYLDKEGQVQAVLTYPDTKLGICARDSLLRDKFLPPPHPAYWVSIYLKLDR